MMPMSSVNPLSFSLMTGTKIARSPADPSNTCYLPLYQNLTIDSSFPSCFCWLPFAVCHLSSSLHYSFHRFLQPLFFAHPVLDAGTDAFSTGPVEPTAFSVFWRLRSRSCRRLRRVFQRGVHSAVGSPFGVNKRPNWGPLANDPLAKCLGNSYQQADPKMSSDSSLLRVILISHCLGNTEKKKVTIFLLMDVWRVISHPLPM